tara:strand:+ start:800 stop:1936 length:1137 start_codon:yes stop_codon:yes gene_type:complete
MTDLTLLAVGDIILDPATHHQAFDQVTDVLRSGDIVFANCDQAYSDLGESPNGFWPIQFGSPPHGEAMLDSLTEAGFNVLGFGNNHSLDWGYEAFFDCLSQCQKRNILTVGAGANIEAARTPAIVEKQDAKVGFLAYCCVGPEGYEATETRPGHAPVRIHTHYEQWDPQPGTPPQVHTFAYREDLRDMSADIERLASQVDVVVVAFHWGVHYIPELIAEYQYEVGHEAVDAGAHLIVGCHAHLPKGVEVYKGRVIFHGMHEFACHGSWSSPGTQPGSAFPQSKYWDWTGYGSRLKQHFGAVPEGVTSRSMVAKISIDESGITRVAYLPCYLDANLNPRIVGRDDALGQEVFEYFKTISHNQGLNTHFEWDGDEVIIET